jgi:hypothetical protein
VRGSAGAGLLIGVVVLALLGLGGALLLSPVRVTAALNEAFVIVPRITGRYGVLKRVTTMLVGLVLIIYGVFIAANTYTGVLGLWHLLNR